MKENYLLTGLKGYAMGAANVIPGVSGGTIALLTGIYARIIASLNALSSLSIWKQLLKGQVKAFWTAIDGPFLAALAAGVVLSVLSLAKGMTYLMAHAPVETWAFFFGLILASAAVLFQGVPRWSWREILLVLLGGAAGLWISTFEALSSTPESLWFIFLCGALAVCTMILPGISGSFILLILGKYDYIMTALSPGSFNLPVILAFAAGCATGLLAFAKFLHWLLGKWEMQTLIVLLGFILGSLVKVWPWADQVAVAVSQGLLPADAGGDFAVIAAHQLFDAGAVNLHIPGAILTALAGIALVLVLEWAGRRK